MVRKWNDARSWWSVYTETSVSVTFASEVAAYRLSRECLGNSVGEARVPRVIFVNYELKWALFEYIEINRPTID